MKLRIAAFLILACSVMACSKDKPLQTVNTKQKGGSVGPFDLALSGESDEKPNTFSVQINQPDGAVDFFLPGGEAVQYLLLKSYSSSVAGCDANAVEVFPLWYSAEGIEAYDILKMGATMMTTPRTRAKLRIVFRGLQGCTTLNFAMVVKKLEVGTLQLSVEERLRGTWNFNASAGGTVSLSITPSRTVWSEYKNGRYTCEAYASPLNSTSVEGGWLVFDRGNLLCQYKFVPGNSALMDLTCHGQPTYGCSLPHSFRFQRM